MKDEGRRGREIKDKDREIKGEEEDGGHASRSTSPSKRKHLLIPTNENNDAAERCEPTEESKIKGRGRKKRGNPAAQRWARRHKPLDNISLLAAHHPVPAQADDDHLLPIPASRENRKKWKGGPRNAGSSARGRQPPSPRSHPVTHQESRVQRRIQE